MRVIYNKWIPMRPYGAINLLGVVWVRLDVRLTSELLRHEQIHTCQMLELGVIPFYLLYLLEWLVRLFQYGHLAYEHISFEREAYTHQRDPSYLAHRGCCAFVRYMSR